jgi:hypothetical protein
LDSRVFKAIVGYSKSTETLKKGYKHDPFICLMATCAVQGILDSKFSYVQVDCGGGKSFGQLLACKYLTVKGVKSAIIVPTDQTLRQLKDHAMKFDSFQLGDICHLRELPRVIGEGRVIILDEFTRLITKVPPQFNEYAILDPLFNHIGVKTAACGFSAHSSDGWTDFLEECYPNPRLFVLGSQYSMLGETQAFNVTAYCCEVDDIVSRAV